MPQIPACATAISALAVNYLRDRRITPTAQEQFDNALPPPYRLTRERYDSKVNVIKEYMGQGGNAQGSIQTTDEAAMLVRAKL
jgi:hypothetical protein